VRLFGDTDVDVILPRPTRRREKRQLHTRNSDVRQNEEKSFLRLVQAKR
jgi:hypothetical protein